MKSSLTHCFGSLLCLLALAGCQGGDACGVGVP